MSTRKDLIEEGQGVLERAGVVFSAKELEWLLLEAEGIRRIDLVTEPEAQVLSEAERTFREYVDRRSLHEPVQHILGYAEFFSLRFSVNRDVLIPRPETEILVERGLELLRERKRPRVLDVGTGSGCIAISIAHMCPDAEVTAIDISPRALEIAGRNAALNRVTIALQEVDLYDWDLEDSPETGFDLIISNPPYIPLSEESNLDPEVRSFEPREALFPGEDHLKPYRALCSLTRVLLTPDGSLMVEVHEDWAGEVADIFRSSGLVDITIHTDLAGKERVVCARVEPEKVV